MIPPQPREGLMCCSWPSCQTGLLSPAEGEHQEHSGQLTQLLRPRRMDEG